VTIFFFSFFSRDRLIELIIELKKLILNKRRRFFGIGLLFGGIPEEWSLLMFLLVFDKSQVVFVDFGEGFVGLTRIFLVTHQNISCYTAKYFLLHTRIFLVTHQNISCYIPEYFLSLTRIFHVTPQNISCYIPEYFLLHTRIFLVTHQNISCHSPEYFMLHPRIFLVTHQNISCYTPEYFLLQTKIFLVTRQNILVTFSIKKILCHTQNSTKRGWKLLKNPSILKERAP
jgi:uncharacterized Zn-finger protein